MKVFEHKRITRIFLDTEFTSLTQEAQLLSLALVAETGEKFYVEFNDYNPDSITDWVQTNVIEHFEMNDVEASIRVDGNEVKYKCGTKEVLEYLIKWLDQFDNIQMWADVPHYDWVLFCELFDGSMNLPENLHFICLDLATLLTVKGYNPDVSRISLLCEDEIPKNYKIHNALSDAEVGMIILKKINGNKIV